MAGEFKPLKEILRELKPLVQRKSSGLFSVVTQDNHSCTIRISNGTIFEVLYSRLRDDEAVRLLSTVSAARARFQPIAISAANSRGTLSQASLRWLLDDFEKGPLLLVEEGPPRPDSVASTRADTTTAQRAVVEKIALNYFGPISTLLCDEAFVDGNDISQALTQIASNLSSAAESQTFIKEATAAVARLR
jgi:hypothetical protein